MSARIVILALFGLAAGCARLEPPPGRSQLPPQFHKQTYSAEALGIEWVGQPGQQTIRWKERISPRTTVAVPLLPPESSFSAQPRIAASINGGKPRPFSIDTGAPLNMLNSSAAMLDKVKIADPQQFGNTFKGLAGHEFAYYAMIDSIEASGLNLFNVFSALRVHPGKASPSLDNVLGITTLAKFSSITLDFPGSTAYFSLDPAEVTDGQDLVTFPFELQSLQMIIEVIIGGYAVNVLFDTGNDAELMLPQEIINELGLAALAQTGVKSKFLGLGGTIEARTFTLPKIQLGGRTFENIQAVSVPNGFPPALGSGFLRQFRVTIDYKSRTISLAR